MRPHHAVAPARPRPDGGASRALPRLITADKKSGGAALRRSFPPFADERSRVLVLGTLPGEESLRRVEYYAHPRNLFWPIVYALFGETPPSAYAERVRFLASQRIAVWDVCEAGERRASADATIRREVPNAIDELLDAHKGIRAVAFNGSGARLLFDRHFARRPELIYLALPSTSPAYASLRFADKLQHWSALREVLERDPGEVNR